MKLPQRVNPIIWAVALLALLLFLGYATEGPQILPRDLQGPESGMDGRKFSDFLVWGGVVLALLGYVGFLWMILTAPAAGKDKKTPDARKLSWPAIAILLLMLGGFIGAFEWLRRSAADKEMERPDLGPLGQGLPGFPGGGINGAPFGPSGGGELPAVPAAFVWVIAGMLGLLVAAIVWRIVTAPSDSVEVQEPQREREIQALQETIQVSLTELAAEPDPRRAILACYRGFLGLMEQQGLPMPASYTAEESLYAALAHFALPTRSLQTLIRLFQVARFSNHQLTQSDKDQTIKALQECKESLDAEEAALKSST